MLYAMSSRNSRIPGHNCWTSIVGGATTIGFGGSVGTRQIFSDMGLTIAYALIASLLIALTLVPAMASGVLKNVNEKPGKLYPKFVNAYEKGLRAALKHKAILLGGVVILLVVSAVSALSMGTAFMPKTDSSQLMVSMEMPQGATVDQTREMSDQVMERISALEDVETVGAMESSGMSMAGGSGNSISMYVLLKSDRAHHSDEVSAQILEQTKDLACTLSVESSSMNMSALSAQGLRWSSRGRT